MRVRVAALVGTLLSVGCSGASAPGEPAKAPPPETSEPVPGSELEQKLRFPDHAVTEVPDGPGWLGVELVARNPAEAGVLVEGVLPRSPAAIAGLATGDVILSIDGEQVQRPADVIRLVSSRRPGDRVGLLFLRQGQNRILAVRLAARPDADGIMAAQFVGNPAPTWRELVAVQGSVPVDLSALRGRVVVLEFWATWCTVCRMTIPILNGWHDRYGARGLTVLGVTTDPAAYATAASVELGISYAVHSDPDATTTRAYDAMAIPTLFLIDHQGTVRDVVVGYQSQRFAELESKVQALLATP